MRKQLPAARAAQTGTAADEKAGSCSEGEGIRVDS